MGLPAEEFISETYGLRDAFQLIDGPATAERFISVHRKINDGRGAQFWGIRGIKPGENPTTRRIDDMEHRLIDMQYLLRSVPELENPTSDTEENFKKWAFTSTNNLTKQARKVASQQVAHPEAQTKKGKSKKLPITYHEAYKDPGIYHPAKSELLGLGDPVIVVANGLEKWRIANEREYEITDEQRQLGRDTIEVFLFSAGGNTFKQALGRAALTRISQQS